MKLNLRVHYVMCFFLIIFPITSFALGDLMLTVQQRARIDSMRSQVAKPRLDISQPAKEIRLNGFYFKSKDGRHKGTVWVNGQQLDNATSNMNVVMQSLNETTKVVDLSVTEPNVQMPFKAGQTLNTVNGEIRDAFQ
jgi:hypothetical protein